MSRVASMPSRPGIRMSIRTTSGRSAAHMETAVVPSEQRHRSAVSGLHRIAGPGEYSGMAYQAERADEGQWDVVSAEAGLTALVEARERAVEELGSAVPAVQLRALLVIVGAGGLHLGRLSPPPWSAPFVTCR